MKITTSQLETGTTRCVGASGPMEPSPTQGGWRQRWVGGLGVLAVSLALTLGGAREAQGGWTAIGPNGGPVTALAINPVTPSTLYAGTDGGVFKSTDGGTSWRAVNTNSYVYALAINPKIPSTLYAGSDGAGVFESTDGGASWTAVLPGTSVFALAIDPMTPSTLYAGTFGGGVSKSTDGGATWTAVNTGLPSEPNRHVCRQVGDQPGDAEHALRGHGQ